MKSMNNSGWKFSIKSNDDQTYAENHHVLAGLQFNATLQIRTSLSILKHHGELFRGPPSKAPRYGSATDGFWAYKTKSWAELTKNKIAKQRLEAIEQPENTHASDVGLVKPSQYLPFLKDFRMIVEKPDKVQNLLEELKFLSQTNAAYQSFWLKLRENYQDFPNSFFYMKFTEIPGVGAKTAKAIFAAGIHTVEELGMATDVYLLSIPGIGKVIVHKLRKYFRERKGSPLAK